MGRKESNQTNRYGFDGSLKPCHPNLHLLSGENWAEDQFGCKRCNPTAFTPPPLFSLTILAASHFKQPQDSIQLSLLVCFLIFSKLTFSKNVSGIRSECQIVWIQIRPDVVSGLIWIQTVCKGYQPTTLTDKELTLKTSITKNVVNSLFNNVHKVSRRLPVRIGNRQLVSSCRFNFKPKSATGNWQLVAGCRFKTIFLNKSDTATPTHTRSYPYPNQHIRYPYPT